MGRQFYHPFTDCFSGERALAQASEQHRLERFFTFPNS